MPSSSIKRAPRVVALTGGIGSGKSTVLTMFRRRGAAVADADAIVRDLLEKDLSSRRAIRRRFGASVMRDGDVDRKALAGIVFSSTRARKDLERILHPRVRQRLGDFLKTCRKAVAIVDVPLLFETGWNKKFETVVVVTARWTTRLHRLKRRGFSPAESRRRMRSQWPLGKKAKRADYVVDNDGSLDASEMQVKKIWKTITQN